MSKAIPTQSPTHKVRRALAELGKLGPVWSRDLATRAGLSRPTVATVMSNAVRNGWAIKVAQGWYEPTGLAVGPGSNAKDIVRLVREHLEMHAPHGIDPDRAPTARDIAQATGRSIRRVRAALAVGCSDPDGSAWAVQVRAPRVVGRGGIEPCRYTAAAEGDDGPGTYIPTEARIRLECEAIQATWTPEERERRCVRRARELSVPGAALPAWFDRSYLDSTQEIAGREDHVLRSHSA